MQQISKLLTTITILTSLCFTATGQQLVGLNYNHALTQEAKKADKSEIRAYTIDSILFETEFFEDFSDYYYDKYPRNNHWLNRYAYINSTYADSMISLGVATLDAYDENGLPYYSENQRIVASDSLTSQPFSFRDTIDPGLSMYFSFFYQPGGKGDMPEGDSSSTRTDTLLLEFFHVDSARWYRIDYILDNSSPHQFKQRTVVVAPEYLKNGFQFRFRNYTSLPAGLPQGIDWGRFSNADMWHIDYIQMRQAESAASMEDLKDMSITEPLRPFLTEYTSVPWSHYTLAQSVIESRYTPLSFSSYFGSETNTYPVNRRFFSIDRRTGDTLFQTPELSNMAFPVEHQQWHDLFSPRLVHGDTEYGMVEVVGYISRTASQRTCNDTVKRIESYYDHYAYDDGTAEMGVSLDGEYESNKRIAMRYRAFRRSSNPDSLRAVLIYFAKSVDSVTLDYQFHLCIRKNNTQGAPSNEILYYSQDPITPDYSGGINEFTRIELTPPISVSDTFFVSLEQITGFLNIGYDVNNNHLNQLFQYTNSSWSQPRSFTPGSLMIRPSFEKSSLLSPVETTRAAMPALSVYPNPAEDDIYFALPEAVTGFVHIQLFNTMGVQVDAHYTENSTLSVQHLSPGIYFMVLTIPGSPNRYTTKFIKE